MPIQNALVVDDSRLARIALSKLLQKQGIEVSAAGSATEAFEMLKGEHPDVIFMDFMMPDMDGYAATKQITSNPDTQNIPVVMCTSQDSEEDKRSAKAHGASGFMTKPTTESALAEVIKSISQGVAIPDEKPISMNFQTEAEEVPSEPEVKVYAEEPVITPVDLSDLQEVYQEIQEVTGIEASVVKPSVVEAPAINQAELVAKAREAAEDYVHKQMQTKVREMVKQIAGELIEQMQDDIQSQWADQFKNVAADVARAEAQVAAKAAATQAAHDVASEIAEQVARPIAETAGEEAGSKVALRLRSEMDQKLVEFAQGVELQTQVEIVTKNMIDSVAVPKAKEHAAEVADRVGRELGSRTLSDGTRYAKQAASDEANAIAQQTMAQVRKRLNTMTVVSVVMSVVAVAASVAVGFLM